MAERRPQPLDPEIAPFFDALPARELTRESLPAIRAGIPLAAELSEGVRRTDHSVGGSPPVTLRVHRPSTADGVLPCIYSMHGGGFVMGSHHLDDFLFDEWSPMLGVVGVSVDYRLAPEDPYPRPLDDCYAGLRWVFENADDLGIDVGRVGVRGLSAGGGLAAALTLLVRDRAELGVAFQLLDSPMLDDRQVTPSSRLDGLAMWTRESTEFGWRAYLGELYGQIDVSPYAAPARAPDLSGLPPAFVSVGGADGFRDETIDYALRLNQAGVPTELHVYTGAPHGYQIAADSALARRSNRDMKEWLTRQMVNGSTTGPVP